MINNTFNITLDWIVKNLKANQYFDALQYHETVYNTITLKQGSCKTFNNEDYCFEEKMQYCHMAVIDKYKKKFK